MIDAPIPKNRGVLARKKRSNRFHKRIFLHTRVAALEQANLDPYDFIYLAC